MAVKRLRVEDEQVHGVVGHILSTKISETSTLTISNGGPVHPLSSTVGEDRRDFGLIDRIRPPNVTWDVKRQGLM